MSVFLNDDELEWFEELNNEAARRKLNPNAWPIPRRLFHPFFNNCLDGWMDAYWDGQEPAQALDRTGWKDENAYPGCNPMWGKSRAGTLHKS